MHLSKKLLAAVCAFLLPLLTMAARAEAPPPVEAFSRLPNLQDAQLSPDGQRLAVLMPLNGKWALVVLPVNKDSGIKPQVATANEWEITNFFWKGDHQVISFLTQTDYYQGTQPIAQTHLLKFDIETQKLTDLSQPRGSGLIHTGSAGHKIINGMALISPEPNDPDHILVSTGREAAQLNINNLSIETTFTAPSEMGDWFVDSTEHVRAGEGYREGILRTGNSAFYALNATGGLERFLTKEDFKGIRFLILGLAQDPSHLIVLSDHETGRLAAYEYDPLTRAYLKTLASDDKYDVGRALRWNGQLVGILSPRTVYFDPDAAALQQMVEKALPDGRAIIYGMTPDRHFALVRVEAADKPTVFYKLTLGDKKKLAFIGSSYPELEGKASAPVTKVQYLTRDGQPVEAILTLPAGQKKPIPFVVMPHGGPTSHDEARFDYWAQFLASRGYGVLQPNFRGSTGYGVTHLRAGYGQWAGTMQNDVDDGTKWLIDQHLADPMRICMVGGSYGGYVALVAATSRPDLYRCAAAFAPVTDVGDLLHRIELFNWKDSNLPVLGNTDRSSAEISPLQQAAKAAMPILLFHGEQDYTVPVEHSHQMEAALKAAGKPVEAVYYKDENHYLSLASTRQDFLARLETFLAHNIGPAPSN
jgi:dipeptidyl aminopeptidase/acylaminoacyl peptidase